MQVILRPGHGLCPPETPTTDLSYCERGIRQWNLQRPGNREDDWTAEFCGSYLIPELVRAGHCVYPQRAMDPVTGQLDTTATTVGPDALPQLRNGQEGTYPRWRYSASVEGALRGVRSCRTYDGSSWSFDPVASCRWETTVPGDGCYLSIHQNWWDSPKMHGCVVLHSGSRSSEALGEAVYRSIADQWRSHPWAAETKIKHWPDRLAYRLRTGSRWGVQKSRLWELRKTRRPAVLVEVGFASNPEDSARMHDDEWSFRMASAIASAL
jgi:hypothetical protein